MGEVSGNSSFDNSFGERKKKEKKKKENGRANIILNRTGILVESFYLATNCSSCRFLGVRSITTWLVRVLIILIEILGTVSFQNNETFPG